MKKRNNTEESKGSPEWMATYADMVTLLMCFFVLLFAFSNIDAQKFVAVMESFQGSAGILSGGKTLSEAEFVFNGMPETQTSNMETVQQNQLSEEEAKEAEQIKEKIEELASELSEYIENSSFNYNIDIIQTATSVMLRFEENALFSKMSADIKAEAVPMLDFLSELVKTEGFEYADLSVEGHTDNTPVYGGEFDSNWDLSAARATNVVRYFVEKRNLDPFRVSSAGYGEYRPIATNTTDAGRALNRRVDIIIKSKLDKNN